MKVMPLRSPASIFSSSLFLLGVLFILLLSAALPPLMQSSVVPSSHSRTLFVIAHPDDEAMFFAPTILTMHDKSHLHLICLSVGNNDGLGKVREKELYKSCAVLGIPEKRVRIHDEEGLQDGMQNRWDTAIVMDIVKNIVDEFQINTIITFDEHGISSHPNHIDVYKGIRRYVSSQENVAAYKLETTNIMRKYCSFLDIFISMGTKSNSTLLYISPSVTMGWKAMRQHYSQLVWFRYLFILFSRYSFVNTLSPIN